MSHTPGPWSAEHIGVTDAGPNGIDVFDIGPCDKEGAMRVRVATVAGDDAALVAAAPELLEALDKLLHTFTDLPAARNYGDLVQQSRAAIAKALGK